MDLIVSGSKDAILMVECGADNVTEAEVLDALDIAHAEIKKLVGAMEELAADGRQGEDLGRGSGRSTRACSREIRDTHQTAIDEATSVPEKLARQEAIEAIKDAVLAQYAPDTGDEEADAARRDEVSTRVRLDREGDDPQADRGRQEASRRSRSGRDPADRDRGRHLPARARLGAVHPR